jgi:hypothetical protein
MGPAGALLYSLNVWYLQTAPPQLGSSQLLVSTSSDSKIAPISKYKTF